MHAEVNMGQWIISDETDESHVLWHEVEVTTDDIELNLSYTVSVWVNGTIWAIDGLNELLLDPQFNEPSDIPEEVREAATNVKVEARSGMIILESISDENGTFAFRMPENLVFHVTASSFAGISSNTLTAGMLITNASELTETDLFLVESNIIQGTVWLRDSPMNGSGTAWGDGISGASGAEVIATDSNGLEWRDELDDAGTFLVHLSDGNWTMSVSNADMNVASVPINASNQSDQVILVANPANITLTMRVFLDTNDDGVWENGTAITPTFNISSVNEFGIDLQVTEEMYNNETGELTVELSVGNYIIELLEDDPRDENASDYRLYSTGLPNIDIGLAASGEPLEVMIVPEYLVSGTVLMESGFPMDNSTVWLRNAAGDDFYPLVTDENGTFAEYVSHGEWYVEVAEYIADSNETEIFRGVLNIDSAISDIVWKTKTAMVVNIQLQEELTNSNITATRITAVSLDGLGNVSLGPSDNSGMISEVLMPGNWTLMLNKTETLESWTLEEGIHNSADSMVNNSWEAGVVSIQKSVLIGGKVFWDLDENDTPSSGEGIEEVNVSITSQSGFNQNVTTDAEGVWKLFVPIRDNYSVVAEKSGFATVNYTDGNNTFYTVNDTHESRDFEMSAGFVSVSGNVTDILGTSTRLDGATVTLYPASGIVRDSITITSTTYANDTLSWSGSIQPGDWIVVVEGTDSDENGGGIAIGLLEASVQDGASIDLVMEKGGLLAVSTSWLSIESEQFHAGDVTDGVEVELDLGDGVEWNMEFDSNGELEMVLPAGNVILDSDFETVQHELNLTMEYTAGLSVDVIQDTAEDRIMEFTRRVNSDLVVEVISIGEDTAVFDSSDLSEMTAIEDGDGYKVITMKLSLTYEGTEISDQFTVSGGLGVTQDAEFWSIEFLNSTGEWTDVMDVTMGIGNNNSDTSQLLTAEVEARVNLPLQNQSQTYDDGHAVNMRFTADGGPNEVSVRVNVPQQYNISLNDAPAGIGVGVGDETLVTLRIVNDGNGDDTVSVQSSLSCEGWQVTPGLSNITVAAGSERSQSFTIFAPADASSEESCMVEFTADSEGEFETQTQSTNAIISVANLVIDEGGVEPRNAEAKANADGQFIIPIRNDGFLTAQDVIVYLQADELGDTDYPQKQVTITVPANGVAYASFDYSDLPPGDARLKVTLDVIGTPTHEDSDSSAIITIKFSNMADEDGESGWLVVVIILLTGLVLYGGFKTAKKGSSGRF